jgi:hypothetical protein
MTNKENIYFRCGWCGNPTDKSGKCLTIQEIPFGTDDQWNSAVATCGTCCPNGDAEDGCQSPDPTDDMLSDAGIE